MADFSAVLKRTIEGLGDSGASTRQKVYDKARQAIRAKLAASNTPLSADVAQRQIKALEDAIETVEFDFRISDAVTIAQPAPARPSPFASSRPAPQPSSQAPAAATPARPAMPPPAFSPRPAPPVPAAAQPPARPTPPAAAPARPAPPFAPAAPPRPVAPAVFQPAAAPPPVAPRPAPTEWTPPETYAFGEDDDAPAAYEEIPKRKMIAPSRGGAMLALVAVAFFLIAGGGAAGWLYRDQVVALFSPSPAEAPAETKEASAPAAGEAPADAAAGPAKFTQRLQEDGSEVDEGPAGGGASVGEGTSVASATQQSGAAPGTTDTAGDQAAAAPADPAAAPADPAVAQADLPGAPADPAPADPTVAAGQQPATPAPVTNAPTAPADPNAAAVAVSQKAIFYEERTNAADGSANPGSVVWSLVMESPGGDLPAEPAIRAEASVPERNMNVRMTIRRNGDKTLPASHIVELVLTGPENPASGSIDNVLRMTFKENEAATGNPLFGVPAKIADGFFLIALTDSKAEIEANVALMKREQWIDIPFVYGSGRRALVTLEKGVPGEKVFEEALKAWEGKASG